MTSIQTVSHPPLASFSFGLPQPSERPTKRYRDEEDEDDEDDLHPRGTYIDYLKQHSASSLVLPVPASQMLDVVVGHATGEDEIGVEADENLECEDGEDPFTALRSQALNPDGTPKRPMNAFMIFAKRRRPQVAQDNASMRTGEISKILSKEWNSMDKDAKQFYNDNAKKLKEDFHKRWPDYVYRRRPNNSRKKRKGSDASLGGVDGYSEDLTASSYPLTPLHHPDEDVKPYIQRSPHSSSRRMTYEGEVRRSVSRSPPRRRNAQGQSGGYADSVQLSPSQHVSSQSTSYHQHPQHGGPLDQYETTAVHTPPTHGHHYGEPQQRHQLGGTQSYGSSPSRANSHSQYHQQHPHDSYTSTSQHDTPNSLYRHSPRQQQQHELHQSRSYGSLSGPPVSPGRHHRASLGSAHQVGVNGGGLWPAGVIEQQTFSHSPAGTSALEGRPHHHDQQEMWNQENGVDGGQQQLRRTNRNDSILSTSSSTRPGTGSMEGSGTTAVSSSAWPMVSPLSEHIALSSGQRSGTSSRMGRPHSNSVSSPLTIGRPLSASRPHSSSLSLGVGGRPLTATSAAAYGILPVTQGSFAFNGNGAGGSDSPPGLEHSQLPYQLCPPQHPPSPPPLQIQHQEPRTSSSWSSSLSHAQHQQHAQYPASIATGYEQQQYGQHQQQHEHEYQQQSSYQQQQHVHQVPPTAQQHQYASQGHSHPTTPVVDDGSNAQHQQHDYGYSTTTHHSNTNTPPYTQTVTADSVMSVGLSRHSSMDTTIAPAPFHYHPDGLQQQISQQPSTTYSSAPRYSISSAPEVLGGAVVAASSDGSLNMGGIGVVVDTEYSGATTSNRLHATSSTPPETPQTEPCYSSMSTVVMAREHSAASMMSMAGSDINPSNTHVGLGHSDGSAVVDHAFHYGVGSVGSGHMPSSSSGADGLVSTTTAGGYILTPSSSNQSSNHDQQYRQQYPLTSVYDPATEHHHQQQQHYYQADGASQVLNIPPVNGMPTEARLWDAVKHEPTM